jgi:hypothetical protein
MGGGRRFASEADSEPLVLGMTGNRLVCPRLIGLGVSSGPSLEVAA